MFFFTNPNTTNSTNSVENTQQLKEQLSTIHKATSQTEKEIVLFLRNAEKDKSDYIYHTNALRQRRQQLIDLIDDFHYEISDRNEALHRLNIHSTELFPFSCNKNNSNPTITHNPAVCCIQAQRELSELEKAKEVLHQKELERSRVARRAADDRTRASCARASSEEMAITLAKETECFMDVIRFMKTHLQKIDREINRIIILAEKDKLNAVTYSAQISQFKRHIEALKSLKDDPKISPSLDSHDMNNMHSNLSRLDSNEDLSCILSSSPQSTDSDTDRRHSPISNLSLQLPDPHHYGTKTKLGKEAHQLAERIQQAKIELDRVTVIANAEKSHALSLKDTVEEMKYGVVGFVKAADDAVGKKAREVKQKQYYIDRYAHRAEKDRIASALLRNQINRTIQHIQEEKPGVPIRKSRKNEWAVEDAYFSQFVELGDLGKENSDPALSASLPLDIAKSFECPGLDIMSTSAGVHLADGAPEGLFVQKMKDLDMLTKELQKKDEQLDRIRRLAEAEKNRHILWKDKFHELQNEYGPSSPIISRTF
eukprot:TRINITY_DN5240_c0_g1_i1.p1 TRINITY_DN5240_c0_g1~~TRINITY_DN5240_c0_g1_i1.p1  ORF type:complete len:581 (+),score=122.44 TRINITY_DN5240_c0_g1_i1:124-1743(+)